MTPLRIVIVGGGPAGLSAALALSKDTNTSALLEITVLELRDKVQSLGGAVNLTPLALRYLDHLGAGHGVRSSSCPVSAIELVSHRTGGLLGSLWPNVDAVRAQRRVIGQSLREAIDSLPQGPIRPSIQVIYNARATSFTETGDPNGQGSVSVTYTAAGTSQTIEADVVIGCDGIHSQVRSALVEADRPKTYSGKCVTYGYADVSSVDTSKWKRADGQPFLTDTVLASRGTNSLLVSYYQPTRDKVFLASVSSMAEQTGNAREGWAAHGADKEGIKRGIRQTFSGGNLPCLAEVIDLCDEWFFFPVYTLPPGGRWYKGRALLIGDAAHAMPPQGESTGVAIEDGVLLAKVLSRRGERSVPAMFADYEALRRADIDKLYKESNARWNSAAYNGWLNELMVEWFTWLYVKFMNWRPAYFGRDVRTLDLPE